MKEKIYINDVGPRDGLQNQSKILSPKQRIQLIEALVSAGLPAVEIGAFVSPKAVPAMAGSDEISRSIQHLDCEFSALIPNMKGFELALSNKTKLMSLVMASSNTMNEKNIRMDNAKTLQVLEDVIQASKATHAKVQVYLATAWGCPFEGKQNPSLVADLAEHLLDMGAYRVVLADTIGAGAPNEVKDLVNKISHIADADKFACHFHDTRAMGLANAYAAIEGGIRHFDASIAGLGGCPFAPGASGNVATEDLVMMCEQMGFNTGINMSALLDASDFATELSGTAKGGKSKTWLRKHYPKAHADLASNQ